jgi:hypothetical protein
VYGEPAGVNKLKAWFPKSFAAPKRHEGLAAVTAGGDHKDAAHH